MGDRALVTFTDDSGYFTPAIYSHWRGMEMHSAILAAVGRFRKDDASYSAARLCGELHATHEGNRWLGLLNGPTPNETDFSWEEYSHGNAGVYVVNVSDGTVQAHAGYGKSFSFDPNLMKA